MSIWTSTTTLPPTRSRRRRQAGAVVLLLLLLSLSICSDRPNHGLSLMLLRGDYPRRLGGNAWGTYTLWVYPVALYTIVNTGRPYKYIWSVCMSHVFEQVTNTYVACICLTILMFYGMIYVIPGAHVCRAVGYTRLYTWRFRWLYVEIYAGETYSAVIRDYILGGYTRGYTRAVTSVPRALCPAAMRGCRFLGGYTPRP